MSKPVHLIDLASFRTVCDLNDFNANNFEWIILSDYFKSMMLLREEEYCLKCLNHESFPLLELAHTEL